MCLLFFFVPAFFLAFVSPLFRSDFWPSFSICSLFPPRLSTSYLHLLSPLPLSASQWYSLLI